MADEVSIKLVVPEEAEQYCFCLTRRIAAFIAGVCTVIKVAAQISFQAYFHASLGDKKVSSDYANFSVFLAGQILQLIVSILLFVAIYKENPDFMWPYLCWLSLNLLLEGFGCLILVYTSGLFGTIEPDIIAATLPPAPDNSNLTMQGAPNFLSTIVPTTTRPGPSPKSMRDLIVYCISLSLSVALIYFTNEYEKELRRREEKEKDKKYDEEHDVHAEHHEHVETNIEERNSNE